MGFADDFHSGVASKIAAAGIDASWNPTGVYAETDFGIVVAAAEPAQPANVMTLNSYTVDDDPSLSDTTLGLQIRTRRDGHNPKPSGDTADALFDLFHGAHNYDLPGGVHVVQSYQRTRISDGPDQNGRWSVIQNFYFDLWRPSPHRT